MDDQSRESGHCVWIWVCYNWYMSTSFIDNPFENDNIHPEDVTGTEIDGQSCLPGTLLPTGR